VWFHSVFTDLIGFKLSVVSCQKQFLTTCVLKSQEQLENGLVSVIPCDPTDFLSTVIVVDGCSLVSKCSEISSLRCLLGDLGVAHCVCLCLICPDVMNETCPCDRALSTSFC